LVSWWDKNTHMIYRVQQFWHALYTQPLTESDLAPARSVLTEEQMALFIRLQTSEQAHSLRVLQTLLNQEKDHPDLLVAALLHDIGKIYHSLCIWERVVVVLGKQFFPNLMQRWGGAQPRGWKRPFVVACEHPKWGAQLAQKAGTSPIAVILIREHQNQIHKEHSNVVENHLLAILQAADNRN